MRWYCQKARMRQNRRSHFRLKSRDPAAVKLRVPDPKLEAFNVVVPVFVSFNQAFPPLDVKASVAAFVVIGLAEEVPHIPCACGEV